MSSTVTSTDKLAHHIGAHPPPCPTHHSVTQHVQGLLLIAWDELLDEWSFSSCLPLSAMKRTQGRDIIDTELKREVLPVLKRESVSLWNNTWCLMWTQTNAGVRNNAAESRKAKMKKEDVISKDVFKSLWSFCLLLPRFSYFCSGRPEDPVGTLLSFQCGLASVGDTGV